MNQHKFASFVACMAAALVIVTPAMGQLINFPVLALAPGGADGRTSLGAGYARGLNDDSGKLDAIGLGVARGMERVSFGISGGYVLDVLPDTDEFTLAGSVGVHLLSDNNSPVQLTLQGGLGWMSVDGAPDNTTLLNIPVGVALQSNSDGPARVWVMPRWNFLRDSTGDVSDTDSNFGASAGGSYATEGGVGIGVAIDLQLRDDGLDGTDSVFGFSAGVFYAL